VDANILGRLHEHRSPRTYNQGNLPGIAIFQFARTNLLPPDAPAARRISKQRHKLCDSLLTVTLEAELVLNWSMLGRTRWPSQYELPKEQARWTAGLMAMRYLLRGKPRFGEECMISATTLRSQASQVCAQCISPTRLLLLSIMISPLLVWGNAQNTTTNLNVPGSVTAGIPVVFTATVTDQNSLPVVQGQVQFCNASALYCEDSSVLGTVQLTSNGIATLKTLLGPGSYSVKAVFIGTNTYAGSVSTSQTTTVTGQLASATSLSVTGGGNSFTMTATVAGGHNTPPSGNVSFIDTTQGNATIATAGLNTQAAVLGFNANTYGLGTGPYAIAIGDFNGDGKLDVAVTNEGIGGGVWVSPGNGDGTFQFRQLFGTQSQTGGSFGVAVGDFNGDGKLDIAVANGYPDNTVGVLLGNGDGTFQTQQSYQVPRSPNALAVGDFNGDGKLDIVASIDDSTNTQVTVLLGSGDGTFQTPVSSQANPSARALAVADFNGDGRLDLVVANANNQEISVLIGNGDGSFQAPVAYGVGNAPSSLAVGDMNGDGKPDIIVANGDPSNSVGILIANGDGTFQAQQTYPSAFATYGVAVGDFNGDGKLDVAVTSYSSSASVSILLGNGDGTLQTQQAYSLAYTPFLLAVRDINGDGRPDIAIADSYYSGSFSVLTNLWQVQATATSVAIAGAGQTHSVFASYGGDSLYNASQSNSASFVSGWQLTVSTAGTGTVTSNDGSINCGTACVSSYVNGTLVTLTANPGSGLTISGWTGCDSAIGVTCTVQMGSNRTVTASFSFFPVLTVSVTGSGNVSGQGVYCGQSCTRQYYIGTQVTLTANPNIGWQLSSWLGCDTVSGATCSVTMNTFRNVFATFTPLTNAVLTVIKGRSGTVTSADGNINCGPLCSFDYPIATSVSLTATAAPGFRLVKWTGCDTASGNSCVVTIDAARYVEVIFAEAVSDFNGDSTSDILWRNAANGAVVMWTMSNGGLNGSQWVYSIPSQSWQIVGTGDFNGDGRADILWRNMASGAVVVWLMNGANIVSSAAVYSPDLNWEVSGIGDFDADGKADILWRNKTSGAVVVWLMNGAIITSSAGIYSPDLTWQIVGLGDFNTDGATDIVWRNTVDGTVLIWFMFGVTIEDSRSVTSVPDPNWQVAGTGDFDGDGETDILWRNKATGSVVAWLMNYSFIASSPLVYTISDPNWQIARLGDFNGDGTADIVWRNSANGAIVAWFMNGGTIASNQYVYSVSDPNWQMY
jgi:hypothetical protein